jgi:subtilisin family serine protease
MAVLIPAASGGSALAAPNSPIVVHRGQPTALSQADIQRLSASATKRSIVIFKNQHAEAPARVASARRAQAVDTDQAAVRNELSQLNTRDVKSFHLVNALAATLSQAEIDNLATNPDVQAVVPDAVRAFNPQNQPGARGVTGASGAVTGNVTPQQICPPNPAVPLLEPEALQVMNVEFQPGTTGQPAAHDLVDGSGVKVGIIADGLDPNNPDLQRDGHSIVFDYQDFSGFGNDAKTDGREAFLDAGAIASQGHQVYDLSGFVNPAHPLPPGCNIRIKGVAPGVTLAVMNLAGPNAGFFNSTIIQAIERAVDVDQVDVLNESIGGNPIPDTRDDPVQLANAAAVAAGVVVVASTGDAGPTNTIGSPASGKSVIAVAGTTTYRVYRQTTRYGTQLSAGGWLSNNITALGSAGTTEFGAREPDVAAPGDRGWTLCSTETGHFLGCEDIDKGSHPPGIWAAGGTSMSCPLVSGTAALVIQAYAKTHNGQKPTPDLVKRIIVSTADDLGAPSDHQGAGLVNSLKAVQLAMSIHDDIGAGTPTGNTLLVDKPNLNAVAEAGHHRSFSIQVTNTGTSQQKLSPTLVGLNPEPVSADTGMVNLSHKSSTFIDGEGLTDPYILHQFNVPTGVDYLNGDIVWDAQSKITAVFETLFDPYGRVAAYSLLGTGHSGRGHVEVRQPTAGTWTAVIFTVDNDFVYNGNIQFSFSTQRFHSTGSVSPDNRTLRPGQTATFDVHVDSVDQPGDHVSTLRLSTGDDSDGGIPVAVRTLVPINGQGGAFDGTLTGGASQGLSGQRVAYQFDVPQDKPSLNIALQLRDLNYHLTGLLTDPTGMPRDAQSTAEIGPGGSFDSIGRTMQFFRASPAAGRWTLSLVVDLPIDGAHLSEPFSAKINFRRPDITARGLPNSPAKALEAGKPVNARIDLVNTGNTNKDFFVDARLRGKQLIPLLGANATTVPLPLSLVEQPAWLVPTNTDLLLVGAQGSVPIVLDVQATYGNPERLGLDQGGNFSLAAVRGKELFPGFFFGLPEPAGPFPPGGLGNGATASLAALAETNPFDSAVTSDTGDLWQQSVDLEAAPYTPLTLGPGQPGTINLVITPNAPSGTVVHGFVEVDTFNLDSASGDTLIVLPYTYRVR